MTDANLVLGYLDAGTPLAGGVRLDRNAAERAIAGLAGALGMDSRACAEGIRRVACAEMAAALRVVTVDRGVDPRGFALMAFGGAGPLHATDIADELGIDRILVPSASGVLAALGLVASPHRRDVQRSVFLSGEDLTAERIAAEVETLADRARRELGRPADSLRVVYELRYRGQSFELPVVAGPRASPDELRERFEAEHAARYGHRDPATAIELVTLRVSASGRAPEVGLSSSLELPRRITGPAVVRLPESTLLVPPPWEGTPDSGGTVHLTRRPR